MPSDNYHCREFQCKHSCPVDKKRIISEHHNTVIDRINQAYNIENLFLSKKLVIILLNTSAYRYES